MIMDGAGKIWIENVVWWFGLRNGRWAYYLRDWKEDADEN